MHGRFDTKLFAQKQCVLGHRIDSAVAKYSGDTQQFDSGRPVGKQQRHGVVNTGVGIKYNLMLRHVRSSNGTSTQCAQLDSDPQARHTNFAHHFGDLVTNKIRITLASFFAYFVMSGMLSPIGVITGQMATHFQLPVTSITSSFSWLTLGILVGAVLALVVFRWAPLKLLMAAVYGMIGLSLASLPMTDSLLWVGWRLGLVGLCCGIGLAAAAFVIASTYNDNQRASMLVITDGFYSMAGIVCGSLATYWLATNAPWFSTYLFVGAVGLVVALLVSMSQLPNAQVPQSTLQQSTPQSAPEPQASTLVTKATVTWPATTWLCIAALCLYTLAQGTILLWLPQYAQQQLGVDPANAGGLVGKFWSGMFASQLFVAWWVLRIGVKRLLVLSVIAASVLSASLGLTRDAGWLGVLVPLWGFAHLGLLKVLLSFATQAVAAATPTLVSSVLLGATTGTAISPWVSSQVVDFGGIRAALTFGTLCYLGLVALVGLAVLRKPA